MTAFEIHAGRPTEVTLWIPALDRHQVDLARALDLPAADRSSVRNEPAAVDRGVRRVVCRGVAPSRRGAATMNINAGSVAGNADGSHPKAETVCSNVDMGLRFYRYHGVDGIGQRTGRSIADRTAREWPFFTVK